MSGRILTERLLATTSLAALIFAAAAPDASALPACTIVPAGGSYSNSGSVACVEVTTSSISITNNVGATIGSPPNDEAVIVAVGATLSGGIKNSGTIIDTQAAGSAGGILVDGLVQGGITNSGTITVASTGVINNYGAIAIGPVIGATSFGGGVTNSGTLSVSADGRADTLLVNVSTFSGSVINAGMVTASAASASSAAFVTGISLEVATLTGGITNSGTISATASVAGGTQEAGASGLTESGGNISVGGGFLNSGIISATATNNGSGVAFAEGAEAFAYTWAGGFSNSGTISATASATSGAAEAVGLLVGNGSNGGAGLSTFAGSILNSGTIAAVAVTTSASSDASASGLRVSGAVFSGGLSNGGTISANASVTGATATARASAAALSFQVSTFSGEIINSGTIASTAASTKGRAEAYGLTAVGTVFTGGLSNGGTISATASASGTSSGAATAAALILGISTFSGAIVNSGTIAGVATSATSSAEAYGVTLNGSIFTGGFSNGGTISASATSSSNTAEAIGLSFSVTTFNGGIVNSGTIAGVATSATSRATAYGASLQGAIFTGGLSNGGTISASATAGAASGGLAHVTALAVFEGTFSGGIANSGSIFATAAATATGGAGNCARAIGVFIDSGSFANGIVNGGSIVATAVNSGRLTGNSASAIGILIDAGSFGGGIVNSASISATASVAGSGTASAVGIVIDAGTFGGGIVNSGQITATASGAGSGFASAIGISLRASTFSGSVSNSGSVIARASSLGSASAIGIFVTSNFAGSIVNSGTIAGLITSGTGFGAGIRFTDAHGTITNGGLIEGTSWGIDVSNANGANTINQTGGLISGGDATSGGAIRLSSFADTVNITGGQIGGNIQGGGSANIVNVNPGSGNTFSYASEILGIGTLNLKSGTLLLQKMSTPSVSTVAYNQSAGSTLALEVSPAATNNHASIAASGAVSLASGSVFQAFEGDFAWTPGTYSYAGVITGDTITGSFASVTSNSPFFTASVAQTASADNLTLTMLSPSQVPGLNANQVSVANAIIGISGGNGTLDQLFTLSNPGPALTQLSGSQFTTTNYQPLIQAWQMFTDSLSDRLSQGDGYGGTVTGSYDSSHGIQFAQADIPQVAQMSDAGQGRPPSMPHQWGAWARGYGLSSNASSTATSAPYSESGAGLIIGADNQITDRIVAGVALNVSSDKASVTGGGFTQTNAYQGSAYGQYSIDPNWYVNGIAGFGWQTYKSARVVSFITTSVDNGSFDGQSYRAYGETGYTLHPAMLPLTRITPYLGLGYLHVSTDGFTESGPTALTLQSMDANSFTTTLGARAAATFQIGGTSFRPELRAAWQHEFLDQAATIRAAFAAAPASLFSATGTGFGRESFLGGAGMTTTITSSTQVFVDYDAKVTGGYTAQAVSGGLRVQF